MQRKNLNKNTLDDLMETARIFQAIYRGEIDTEVNKLIIKIQSEWIENRIYGGKNIEDIDSPDEYITMFLADFSTTPLSKYEYSVFVEHEITITIEVDLVHSSLSTKLRRDTFDRYPEGPKFEVLLDKEGHFLYFKNARYDSNILDQSHHHKSVVGYLDKMEYYCIIKPVSTSYQSSDIIKIDIDKYLEFCKHASCGDTSFYINSSYKEEN